MDQVERWYTDYHEALLLKARTFPLLREGEAEDLVQQAWALLLERREDIDPSRSVSGYLVTILTNLYLDCWRRQARRPPPAALADDIPAPTATDLPLQSLEREELHRYHLWLVRRYTPAIAVTVQAFVDAGFAHEKAAETLNCSVDSFRASKARLVRWAKDQDVDPGRFVKVLQMMGEAGWCADLTKHELSRYGIVMRTQVPWMKMLEAASESQTALHPSYHLTGPVFNEFLEVSSYLAFNMLHRTSLFARERGFQKFYAWIQDRIDLLLAQRGQERLIPRKD